jgi:hypothetical protein
MKLKSEYPMVELEGETVIVFAPNDSESFRGMLRLNQSARFIFECLKEETDEEGIVQKLKEEFEGDETKMRKDISMMIQKLRIANALEE